MYLSIKALHIILIVAWFAGLFYIFRLFVYHRQNSLNFSICELMGTMEKRLFYMIIMPASILAVISGLTLLFLNPIFITQGWFWTKIMFVVSLFIYQFFSFRVMQRFEQRHFFISERVCRIINEVPTIVLISVVFLVVVKPIF
jgi:putative membrane protein